jgi:hypothetical protein
VTIHNTTPLFINSLQPGASGPHLSGETGHTNETVPVTDAEPKRIQRSYTPDNVKSFEQLKDRWVDAVMRVGHASTSMPLDAYFKKRIPIESVGHQNGIRSACRCRGDDS